jgi:hypothetical protein
MRGSLAGVVQFLNACNPFWAFSLAETTVAPAGTASESAVSRDVTLKSRARFGGLPQPYCTLPYT